MTDSNATKPIGFLFDLDGVLIDSESEYSKIWTTINEKYKSGIPDFASKIKGMTLDNILKNFPDSEKYDEIRDMLHDLESRMTYRWLPEAKEFIEWLVNNNIPRALVTSSDDKKMEHLREELPELEGLFTEIITANRITKSKPDPEGYLLAASMIGADIRNCVVIEDSMQGVNAGKNSGAYVIGVAGTWPAEEIEPFCNVIVNNLGEVDKDKLIDILANS